MIESLVLQFIQVKISPNNTPWTFEFHSEITIKLFSILRDSNKRNIVHLTFERIYQLAINSIRLLCRTFHL